MRQVAHFLPNPTVNPPLVSPGIVPLRPNVAFLLAFYSLYKMTLVAPLSLNDHKEPL